MKHATKTGVVAALAAAQQAASFEASEEDAKGLRFLTIKLLPSADGVAIDADVARVEPADGPPPRAQQLLPVLAVVDPQVAAFDELGAEAGVLDQRRGDVGVLLLSA